MTSFINLCIFFILSLSSPAWSQQNFFNIPSGQLTRPGKYFYQHQLNLYAPGALSSKQHLVYGIAHGLEGGVNFLNFTPRQNTTTDLNDPAANTLALTFQKRFRLDRRVSFNVGTQAGTTQIGTGQGNQFTSKSYGLLSWHHRETHLRVTGGAWISDRRFNGNGDTEGILLGAEWKYSDRFYLMGDWISGGTKNSVAVLGGMADVTSNLQLCYGVLFPNKNSREGEGLVLELNLFN